MREVHFKEATDLDLIGVVAPSVIVVAARGRS
jgi:hypothetical protein